MIDEFQNILATNSYATISTVDATGLPWAAPVWYVYENKTLYWWSSQSSQHSLNIALNGSVYVTIFDSTLPEGKGLGAYCRAEASEIQQNRLEEICKLYNATTQVFKLNKANCSGEAPTRLYQATIKKAWINSESIVNNQYVDSRVEIQLDRNS